MEDNKIIFDTEVRAGKSVESVKSIRTELRQLTQELANLEPGSKAFNTAATRAGLLRDKMDDAKMAIKGFNPEAKFQAFAGAIGGVANGFAVAQGAMALFGTENKDVERAILKTQAAIAIATGLNGIMGMKEQLKVLSGVIQTNVVRAFASMRAAMISTGILALVAVVGSLIYSWTQETKANEAATKELERFNTVAAELAEEKRKLAVMQAKGEAKEIQEVWNERNRKIEEINARNDLTNKERDDLAAVYEKQKEQQLLDIKTKYLDEKAKKEKEHSDKLAQIRKQTEIDQKEHERKRKESLRTSNEEEAQMLAEDAKALKKEESDQKEHEKKRRESLRISNKEELDMLAADAEAKKKIDKEVFEQKLANLQTVSGALASFAQLAGEQTELGKGLAIASTIIETYAAAQKAYSSYAGTGPWGIALGALAAAAAVASGMARVNAIRSVQVPGESGGSNVSIPSGGQPPILRPSSTMVQLDQSGKPIKTINSGGKVYVTETDITATQNKVKSISRKATIQ